MQQKQCLALAVQLAAVHEQQREQKAREQKAREQRVLDEALRKSKERSRSLCKQFHRCLLRSRT